MKKTLLALALVATTFGAFAQTPQTPAQKPATHKTAVHKKKVHKKVDKKVTPVTTAKTTTKKAGK